MYAQRDVTFSIERRSGLPLAQNRWFCSAPLPTDEHLALLEQMEKDLS
jgi:hypothetical protein